MRAADFGIARRAGQFLHDMREGSRRMGSVVFALMFKEFKNRASRDNRLGLLWIVIDPMVSTVIMASFWYLYGRTEIAGVNVVLFIAVATAPYSIVAMAFGSVPRALAANRVFYNYQQVKPFDSVLAEFTLEVTLLLSGEALFYAILWWGFGLAINLANIMPLLAILGLAAIASFGIALAAATYGALYEPLSKAINLLGRPLFFISPLFYDPNSLPGRAREALSWNPVTHLIEYARYYGLGLKLFPEAGLAYPMLFALASLCFGLMAYYPNRLKLLKT